MFNIRWTDFVSFIVLFCERQRWKQSGRCIASKSADEQTLQYDIIRNYTRRLFVNMFFMKVFCTFTLTLCIPGTTGDCGVCVPQPIENVYPECFRGGEKTGIAVRREDFRPICGYAVCPFDAPDENRNHFERRKPNENVLFVVIHFTGEHVDFATAVRLFTSNITRGRVSSHYVIAKPAEAAADRQLLQVKNTPHSK